MSRGDDGWWHPPELLLPGADYAYLLDDDDTPLPDPRSQWQPHGVFGPSRVYDHAAFRWTDAGWTGRALPGSVLYELHIGTFTPGRTFDAAVERLDYLATWASTCVEVMPVNAFDGTRGWGYDGVLWFAVHEHYGGPDGFKRFVDGLPRARPRRGARRGLQPPRPVGGLPATVSARTSTARTSGGPSLNVDGPGSRRRSARTPCRQRRRCGCSDFHVDGLRLDAVHAIARRPARTHLLEEMARPRPARRGRGAAVPLT